MSERLLITKRISGLIGMLVLLALACNAPIDGNQTPSPPPTNSAVQTPITSDSNQEPTAEVSPTTQTEPTTEPDATTVATSTETPLEAPTETATSLPTFTPIQATASPDATPTHTPEPTEAVTNTPESTATSEADAGPLSFTYAISWEVVSGNPSLAIATVSVVATGGGGDYQYFRDDIPVDGPVFQYEWATCRANPGSIRVTSADGQSVKVDYFEQPPCPSS